MHQNFNQIQNTTTEFWFFPISRVLLAAAAAKPGRSTLDPKKGYKTKTGSTSSVTLTLTLTFGGSDVENHGFLMREDSRTLP